MPSPGTCQTPTCLPNLVKTGRIGIQCPLCHTRWLTTSAREEALLLPSTTRQRRPAAGWRASAISGSPGAPRSRSTVHAKSRSRIHRRGVRWTARYRSGQTDFVPNSREPCESAFFFCFPLGGARWWRTGGRWCWRTGGPRPVRLRFVGVVERTAGPMTGRRRRSTAQ